MPALWILLGQFLAVIIVPLVKRICFALGFGLVTYVGVDLAIGTLKTQALAELTGLPPEVLHIVGLMNIDDGITLIFSAITTRLFLAGLTSLGLTRPVWRNPGTP